MQQHTFRRIAESDWRSESEPWGSARSNLYVVQEGDDGPLKVGIAGHPFRRLGMLQTGNYRRLHMRAIFGGPPSTCQHVERYVHRYFGTVGGEWLVADIDDVLRIVAAFERTGQ